ncbi:cornifelin homolog [Ruditapes philippinarum]|uniref:cornifelin homolog n=1 Tax=Ruditapes philippinarum TaxID=129788 RepID=UPI00295C0BBB|nr:cornifelin homolog [Ruditapes philippinarum]XP_060598623.1 cornifelin homolog [Ruditapes philippinarum]
MSVQHADSAGQAMQGQPSQGNTTVIIQQPQTVTGKLVGNMNGHRDWSSGLFGCMDDGKKCIMALVCTECVLADIAHRTGESVCVPFCIPGGLVAIRARLRALGGIQGSICNDYMALYCCYFCTLCQMHRELDHMGL